MVFKAPSNPNHSVILCYKCILIFYSVWGRVGYVLTNEVILAELLPKASNCSSKKKVETCSGCLTNLQFNVVTFVLD